MLALTLNNTVKLWAGKLDLSGSEDLTLEGEVLGPGMITKSGTGVLTLNAANHYEGGTLLSSGKLLLGNNAALGSGVLQIAKHGTSLATRRALTLNNHIELNADLNVAEGSQDMTLNGVIKGEGKIIKSGSAALQLNQSNSQGGIQLIN